MSEYRVLEGLLDSIRRIATTVDRGSSGDINDALTKFSTLTSLMLKPFVKSQLKLRRLDGPDRMVDEAGDILNRLLLELIHSTMPGYSGRADDPQRRLYDDFTEHSDESSFDP